MSIKRVDESVTEMEFNTAKVRRSFCFVRKMALVSLPRLAVLGCRPHGRANSMTTLQSSAHSLQTLNDYLSSPYFSFLLSSLSYPLPHHGEWVRPRPPTHLPSCHLPPPPSTIPETFANLFFHPHSWSIIIGLIVVVSASLIAWFFAPKGENQTYDSLFLVKSEKGG